MAQVTVSFAACLLAVTTFWLLASALLSKPSSDGHLKPRLSRKAFGWMIILVVLLVPTMGAFWKQKQREQIDAFLVSSIVGLFLWVRKPADLIGNQESDPA
ncbi:MAG: hypothetical protein AAFU85_20535 [Planctomycetota bacterium]